MTRLRNDEQGLVMVPVIAFIAVGLMLALALLALTDVQTRDAKAQRSSDAAQVLAEGAAAATANALASNTLATDWPTTGACRTFTGNLTTASAAASTTLEARITKAVQERFASTSNDYAGGVYSSTWKVNVCPVTGTGNGTTWDQTAESRWADSFLTRTITAQPSGRGPGQISLWVRGQATVSRSGTAVRPRVRAVATKVRQSTANFTPPLGFAVGTGSFSTDLTTTVSGLASGPLLGSVLGTSKPLIAPTSSKLGVRCGLLNTLNNPSSVCLSGTISGVAGATNGLGLGTLNTLLGIDRAQTLSTWTMAPTDAQEGYRSAATIYKETVGGSGSIATKSASGAPECYTDATDASSVVYIKQVGNGGQYCTITGTAGRNVVKALVIERGGVRITGPFTGLVYALNRQECGDDGTCTADERTNAPVREVVRIEGNTGKVTGAVWADGSGGTVGIYPSLTSSSTASAALLGDVCNLPLVGPLLNVVGQTLTGVLTGVLNLLATKQEEVRYPGGTSAPTGCSLLTAQLGTLTGSQLLNLFATGGSVEVPISEHRTRNCTSYLVVCLGWGPWSDWTTKQTQTVTLPALTSDLVGALTSVLSNYTAIEYSESVVVNAGTSISVGSGPVIGTYRNVAPN